MSLVEAKEYPKCTVGICPSHLGEAQHFRHHEKHDESAIRIDGDVADRHDGSWYGEGRVLSNDYGRRRGHSGEPFRCFQSPRVKSGNVTGMPPWATDFSLSSATALQLAKS